MTMGRKRPNGLTVAEAETLQVRFHVESRNAERANKTRSAQKVGTGTYCATLTSLSFH